MKPNSVIRTLFAALLLILFCFGNPVFAADLGTSKAAVNSYRKNLSKLRAKPAIEPEQLFEGEVTRFLWQDSPSPLPKTIPAPTPQKSDNAVSDNAFFAHIFNNRFNNKTLSASAKPSPYAVIAAAHKTNPTTRPLFAPPSFAKQLPQQLSEFRTGLQVQPVRVIEAARQVGPALNRQANGVSDRIHQIPQIIKTALSKALDQAGTKAHQTAEQIRQY